MLRNQLLIAIMVASMLLTGVQTRPVWMPFEVPKTTSSTVRTVI